MLAFVLRRLLQAVIVMLTVAFVAFMLFQYVGDPVSSMLGQDATPEQREQLRADLGLDAPFPLQFARFVGNAVRGDFGLSLRQGRKVSALIAERFPATLELSLAAAVVALAVGVPLGVYAALRRGSFGAQLAMTGSLLGVSLPTFLIGILLILVFAVLLGWLPSFGRGETVALGAWSTGLLSADGWLHLILPALTLSIFQLALILRLVRAEMLEVLRTDYIKFARARGLSDRAVHFGHALRNTLLPVITITGFSPGTYRYAVNLFAGTGTLAGSGAQVQVFDVNGLVDTQIAPTTGGSDVWWYVYDVTSSGVTPVNMILPAASVAPYADTGIGCP